MVQYTAATKYHEFLSAVTQYAAEGILAYSRSGQVILANAAVGKIFDMDAKEMETKTLADLIPDGAEKEDIIARMLMEQTEKQDQGFEFNILQTSGTDLPVDVMVGKTQLTDGEEIYISNWRDITERRKTEERLVRQAEIINQMHDAVLVADTDFNLTECNKAFEKLLQTSKPELLGKSIYEVAETTFPDGMSPEDVWDIAITSGRWHGIIDIANTAGDPIKADCILFPMRDRNDEISYFISVLRDVTERVEADRRIQETQRIESLGRLAGGVAHDINNLLFPIFLNLEEAADDVEEGVHLEDAVVAIRSSMDACMKIKQMIEQILHFSRDTTNGETEMDMAETVKDAWELTKMIIPTSQETEVSFDPAAGIMTGNAVQISQVLLNLVSNAVAALDHMPGIISVKLESRLASDIPKPRYYDIRGEHYAVLSVTDTGCGIPEDIMGRILDPFFTTKGVGEGTGLGLTEVAGIVRDCKGALDIKSKVDKGTTITLYFPVTPVAELQTA